MRGDIDEESKILKKEDLNRVYVFIQRSTLFRLAGQGPFWHRKDTMMYRKIMEGKYDFNTPEWDDQSELSKNLVSF